MCVTAYNNSYVIYDEFIRFRFCNLLSVFQKSTCVKASDEEGFRRQDADWDGTLEVKAKVARTTKPHLYFSISQLVGCGPKVGLQNHFEWVAECVVLQNFNNFCRK